MIDICCAEVCKSLTEKPFLTQGNYILVKLTKPLMVTVVILSLWLQWLSCHYGYIVESIITKAVFRGDRLDSTGERPLSVLLSQSEDSGRDDVEVFEEKIRASRPQGGYPMYSCHG